MQQIREDYAIHSAQLTSNAARTAKIEQALLHPPSSLGSDPATRTQSRVGAPHGVDDHRSNPALSSFSASAQPEPFSDHDSDVECLESDTQLDENPDCNEEFDQAGKPAPSPGTQQFCEFRDMLCVEIEGRLKTTSSQRKK
jgi:hypothetical protein